MICYVYMGLVERWSGRRYRWYVGYSENGNTFPCILRREAQRDARARGSKAVFIR